MKLHKKIYLGDGIESADKYLKKLNKGKVFESFYVVVIINDNIEIYSSFLFWQSYYRKQDFVIVAICKNQNTAFEYIRRITDLSYKKYDEFNLIKCIDELDLYDIDYLYDDCIEDQ